MSKYLLSGFRTTGGYLIKSPMLRDIEIDDEHTVPPKYLNEEELIIENIERVAHTVGFFSSKTIGMDEIDSVSYPLNGDDYNENLSDGRIECSESIGINFPYNSVIYHKKNEWKFQLIIREFQMKYMIIPRECFDIPNVFNIKRTSGKIQKARIGKNSGIVLRTSRTNRDTKPYLYIKVYYYEDVTKELTNEYDGDIDFYKDVKLDSIIELNPDIEEININLNLYNINDNMNQNINDNINQNINENIDNTQKKVIEYFNDKYIKWFNESIRPVLLKLDKKIKINC